MADDRDIPLERAKETIKKLWGLPDDEARDADTHMEAQEFLCDVVEKLGWAALTREAILMLADRQRAYDEGRTWQRA